MSKRLLNGKKIAAYIGMPLLFWLIIAAILAGLYFGFLHESVGKLLTNSVLFSSVDLSDASDTIADSIYDGPGGSGSTVSAAEVTIPNYGTQYGEIVCDRIGLRCALYFGDSDAVLKKGAGQTMRSLMPGFGQPTMASGHNNRDFNRLQHVVEGDIIEVLTNYGTYRYKVSGTEIIRASAFDENLLLEQRERLILYTCYPFNTLGLTSQRFFVYAEKISGPTVVFD